MGEVDIRRSPWLDGSPTRVGSIFSLVFNCSGKMSLASSSRALAWSTFGDVGEEDSVFFFSSGTADHALRLGPYMRRSCLRKLLHGHRWSHAAWQIIKTKTQTTKNKRQDADPPARFASHHPKDSKANSERGKSPTETTTKDLPRTQW